MTEIEFSREEKAAIVTKLQRYFEAELDQEIGQFDAEFLLDFISKEFGAVYYNKGLNDAQAILQSRLDSITDAIYEIEMPIPLAR